MIPPCAVQPFSKVADTLPEICDSAVTIFTLPFDGQNDDDLAAAEDLLSADEHTRAEQFRFNNRKHQYITTRALLRVIVGHYMGIVPQQVKFCYEGYGKPFLLPSLGLNFNVSHCGGCAAIAVARSISVGVDIENVHSVRPDYLAMVERLFCEDECNYIEQLSAEDKSQCFIECWTLKEAYLKALGVGLSKGLKECEFTFPGDGSLCFVDNAPTSGSEQDWHFGLFALLGSYRLSVAYEACLRDDLMPVWIINLRRECERAKVTQLCSGGSVQQFSKHGTSQATGQ